MKCDVCDRELSPGEGFVRLEAYVVVSAEVFRASAGMPGGRCCMLCHEPTFRAAKALLEGVKETERRQA